MRSGGQDMNEIKDKSTNQGVYNRCVVEEFVQILLASKHEPDQATIGFGEYLKAARINSGLSFEDVEIQTGILGSQILALEKGIYANNAIKNEWLDLLATAYDENRETLYLLLGRQPEKHVVGALEASTSEELIKIRKQLVDSLVTDVTAEVTLRLGSDDELVERFCTKIKQRREKLAKEETHLWRTLPSAIFGRLLTSFK